MPYIPQEKRNEVDTQIDALVDVLTFFGDCKDADDGVVNYAITRLLNQIYCLKEFTTYTSINKAIGVLECIKLEFYRKIAAPYEYKKSLENGEVYV